MAYYNGRTKTETVNIVGLLHLYVLTMVKNILYVNQFTSIVRYDSCNKMS